MKNIQREDIHLISRYSNLTQEDIEKSLESNVYNSKEAWLSFFRLLLGSLAVGFTVSGIIFFLAYNWAGLHKFVKLGLTEGLLIAVTGLVLLAKIDTNTRNLILTGVSFLIGALFALFGQIYQTGADSYNLFLAWTIFITLWVAISDFAPLWLLYIILVNTTLLLYIQQIAKNLPDSLIFDLLLILNSIFLISGILISRKNKAITIPTWFLNTLALVCAAISTLGISIGILDHYKPILLILISLVTILFTLGVWYALKINSIFYLSLIAFSLIIIASSLLANILDNEIMFLLVGVFIASSITLTVRFLLILQKKWVHEN